MSMIPVLIPAIVVLVCWVVSLRRTPFPVGWLGISVTYAGVGTLIVTAALAVHHTVVGLVAAELAACVLPLASTGFVEGVALGAPGDLPGDVALWRQNHRRATPRQRWEVRARPSDKVVWVYIVCPGFEDRLIGSADPLTDMDAFMDLRTKAEQAAETFNALRIGT